MSLCRMKNPAPFKVLPQIIHFTIIMIFLLITAFYSYPIHAHNNSIPKSLIIFIGDGMGPGYPKLGEAALGRKLIFQNFPHQNQSITTNALGEITDSAAGGTAIATGRKVANGVVSVAIPGDGKDLKTILEIYKAQGKSVGIITNTTIDDATPAAFAAHVNDRSDYCGIWSDYFTQTKPNLILGYNYPIETDSCNGKNLKQLSEENGYVVVQKLSELKKVNKKAPLILGIFGLHNSIPGKFPDADNGIPITEGPLSITDESYFTQTDTPRLRQMIEVAIEILSKNKKGYFLMVENSHPDRIGHAHELYDNDVFCVLFNECLTPPASKDILATEMKSVDIELKTILKATKNDPDLMLLVTADHETGGLKLTAKNPLQIEWTAPCSDVYELGPNYEICEHTGVNVGIYATGKFSQRFDSRSCGVPGKGIQNTEIFSKIFNK